MRRARGPEQRIRQAMVLWLDKRSMRRKRARYVFSIPEHMPVSIIFYFNLCRNGRNPVIVEEKFIAFVGCGSNDVLICASVTNVVTDIQIKKLLTMTIIQLVNLWS